MTAPVLSVPTANGRYYQDPNGMKGMVPSVTNILDMMNKPGLKYWAAKECATYASQNREKLATLTEDEAWQLVRGAPFARHDDSPSAIGDIVHGWIERRIKGDSPTHDEVMASHQTVKWMWNSFLKFEDHYKPQFTDTEFTVWSDRYGYAGTADLAMRINGLNVLTDTKTGKNIYPDTAMQLAALANADVILSADGTVKPVPKFDRFAILHIRPRSASLVPVENIDEAFKVFLALKIAFDWKVNFADRTLGFAPKVS